MKIKKGLYMLLFGLVGFDMVVFMLGVPTYIFGFVKNMKNNILFVVILLAFILLTIGIYFCAHIFKKTFFIIKDKEIVFYKKNIKQYSIQLNEIKNAEYFCFTFSTILNQSSFGYLKISIDNQDIIIDMSKKKAKKISEKYFNIEFIK